MVLQDRDIFKWIAIDEDTVCIEAFLDLAQLMLLHEEFGHASRGGDDGFHGREAEQLHEMLQVSGVRPMRSPRESVVASRKNDDATAVHFSKTANSGIQFPLVAYLLSLFIRVPKCCCVMD